MILFVHPSIHLSSANLFVFCLFVCFSFGRGRRGRDFTSYLPYPCQLALHLQRHHNALPNSLSLWNDAGIKHLFYQSISLYRWRSVFLDVGINTMVLLLKVKFSNICRWKYSHEFAWSLAKRYLKQSIAVKISVTGPNLLSDVGYGQAYSLEFNVFTRVIISFRS